MCGWVRPLEGSHIPGLERVSHSEGWVVGEEVCGEHEELLAFPAYFPRARETKEAREPHFGRRQGCSGALALQSQTVEAEQLAVAS